MYRFKKMPQPVDEAAPVEHTRLPGRMRGELNDLADDAGSLDRSIAEHIAGAVVLDRRNSVNLGVVRVSMRFNSVSYRAREALLTGADCTNVDGAEWVTVRSSTTLRHLLNQYGDRLLGFDTKRDEITFELLSLDIIDSVAKTVRVLVRKLPNTEST
jgi:hypothetical protein